MSRPAIKGAMPTDIIAEVSRVVMEITGVQLGEAQRSMVRNRLNKRISDLGLGSEEAYLEYFAANRAAETAEMVSLLTTHHTYFFREFAHFEYLIEQLPALVARVRARRGQVIKVWSAACSRGQEAYSLAMLFATHLPKLAPELRVDILGTDVDPASVAIATNGVYKRQEIKEIPAYLAAGHWSRGTGDIADFVRAKDSIRAGCRFKTANLLQVEASVAAAEAFDIIFCRNVFIYFTPAQIKAISECLLQRLTPDGQLFIGISESLGGLGLRCSARGPSIYARMEAVEAVGAAKAGGAVPSAASASAAASAAFSVAIVKTPAQETARPLRVFCVDDSASILGILQQLLKPAQGFEIVGTAVSGLDAARKLPGANADLMTLDIHMPEQNGLEYLRENFSSGHPPVVMISSVAREDGDLALRCLAAGAADYVEKPSLANMAARGEEIRAKLRSAYRAKSFLASGKASRGAPAIDLAFARNSVVPAPEKALRLAVAGLGHLRPLGDLLSELKGSVQPPLVICVEGASGVLPAFAQSLSRSSGQEILVLGEPAGSGAGVALRPGQIQLADLDQFHAEARALYTGRRTAILVYGDVSSAARERLSHWREAQVLVEDLGQGWSGSLLAKAAADLVPATSFAYMSTHYLSQVHGRS